MVKINRKKLVYIVVILTIIVLISIFWIIPKFLGSTVKIVGVRHDSDVHIIDNEKYWDFFFYVDIVNSGWNDVSDLELVVELKVNHITIASDSTLIGTLKAGWESKNNALSIFAIRNDQLFDAEGNYKGDITAVIKLYSGDRLLDEITVGVF